MILESLKTRDFRNLAEQELSFGPSLNVFVGDNGQGKTNLLEAIYLLATTRSFRTTQLGSLPRLSEPALFVRGDIRRDGLRKTLALGLQTSGGRKRELSINGESVGLRDYVRQIPVVAYSAARLEVIRGGPDEKRRFLDRGIATLDSGFLDLAARYRRALRQRNALISGISIRQASMSALSAWDHEWLEAARRIVVARATYADRLVERFHHVVAEHRYHVRGLQVRYLPRGFDREGNGGADALAASRSRDLRVGYTTVGPHRDTVEILIEGEPAAEILSAGEQKMTVLFLKLAKITLTAEALGFEPLFLLDDVDAELDLGIIERLLRNLGGRAQTFTTSAKAEILEAMDIGETRRFRVRQGIVSEEAGG